MNLIEELVLVLQGLAEESRFQFKIPTLYSSTVLNLGKDCLGAGIKEIYSKLSIYI